MISLVLLWSTVFGLLAVQSAPRIVVVIVDDTGAPVPGARVFLTGLTDSVHRVAEADVSGEARFESLPAGDFDLAAEKNGFARGVFGPSRRVSPIPISVAQGVEFKATIVIQRLGAIQGRVSDEKGDPQTAEVRLLRYQRGTEVRRLQVVSSSRSSPDGVFRFPSVSPGDYFVCARAIGIREAGTLTPVPACFGGSREPAGAAALRVSPGDLAGDVNVFVRYEPPARLQGKVLDPNGQPAASAEVNIVPVIDDGFGMTSIRTGISGEFAATLLPGLYHVVVRGAGSAEVTMTAGTISEVLVPLGRGANLSGRIVTPDGTLPALPVGTTVFELVPAPSAFSHLMSNIPVRVTDASSLSFVGLAIPPGDYRIKMQDAVKDWLPVSAASGNRDLLADGLRIQGTDQIGDLAFALVRASARIAGRVVGPDDRPIFDRKVLVFPADRRYWTRAFNRIRWAQPGTDGQFEISALPAGQFLIALIADAVDEEWTPEILEAAATQAISISLEEGQRLVQGIKIAR
jgi:hypothetical protein